MGAIVIFLFGAICVVATLLHLACLVPDILRSLSRPAVTAESLDVAKRGAGAVKENSEMQHLSVQPSTNGVELQNESKRM